MSPGRKVTLSVSGFRYGMMFVLESGPSARAKNDRSLGSITTDKRHLTAGFVETLTHLLETRLS